MDGADASLNLTSSPHSPHDSVLAEEAPEMEEVDCPVWEVGDEVSQRKNALA